MIITPESCHTTLQQLDKNHIRTLGDYSRPSHEGYRNTIELPDENNVVPLRFDTIRLVQNVCSFHRLRSEDPNQHLKNFLKIVDSLDLDVANRERTRRTAKLRNDTLMFQQHQVNLFLKHGLVSRTYSKKSLIMALIFGFKSKSFTTMSIPTQGESSISQPVDNDHNAPVSTEEEVIEETEELGEEIKEETEEEEEDDPEYFDTFPTDTSSVLDPYLGGMVLGKPFTKETGLICDRDERTITFERDKGKITFKIPQKMERFKCIDKDILKMDNILPFLITGDDSDQEKTHYLNSLNIGPTYRREKSMTKAIQCLIKMKSRADEGGVT
nr:zinc finger, CCHC-type [Tanacetum cinerariifolium]